LYVIFINFYPQGRMAMLMKRNDFTTDRNYFMTSLFLTDIS